MPANDNLTPRERLAKIVAEETDDGRRVVRFFVQVAEGQRDDEGFQSCHRMDAAKELVKIGLTEFEDYVRANAAPRKPRARTRLPEADLSPAVREAREQLAAYARELTQDGRTVIRMYAQVMEGDKNDEGFKPHHRIAAARELIKRGFDETHTHAASSTVIPAKAGIHQSDQPVTPEVRPTEDPELIIDNSELKIDEEPVDYVAMAKEIVANLDPSEFEEEPPSTHKPDYSMWDYIESLPQPEMTEEHARIGAAMFRETIERQRLWEKSNVKVPTQRTTLNTPSPDPRGAQRRNPIP